MAAPLSHAIDRRIRKLADAGKSIEQISDRLSLPRDRVRRVVPHCASHFEPKDLAMGTHVASAALLAALTGAGDAHRG